MNSIFEKYAAKKIDYINTQILISWSGAAESSFKSNYNKNYVKVLERGSSHIEFQKKILEEEYKKFSIKREVINKEVIEKELREYELADYIMVPSLFAKKTFLEFGVKEEKIICIPYGVDLKEFNKNQKIHNNFIILNVGQISLRKGSYYLLKAFMDLNLKDCELHFVGNIDFDMKNIIGQFKKNKNIKFFNHVPQNKLKNFYNNSDIFVIPSIEEGMAVVQLQAMACGLPVISTTNSGGSDIIDENENGYVIKIRDIEQLKKKISYLYYNRQVLKRFSENSFIKANKFLSWDNYGDKISSLYSKIIRDINS
ncbi:glycosyltransferase family 4 protein [Candidatus Pelagibacter bacterium nBUS_44]|uniref:glycosyltransferase family 4 protein n=1 Tax=Candidatus Pelagibacter bacterium nBUS_44 TaxID=3374195 RepID=UPI003EBEB3F4